MASSSELTPLQVSEITKAFSLCDTDGNGEIDVGELRNVMTHITGIEPSQEDVERMMVTVDKDNSGTVSLNEFLEAVGEWLSETSSGPAKRFKTSSAEEEKKELHHQIKGFFSQFKKAENYEDVRAKISDAIDAENGMGTGIGWFGYRGEGQTSQQKLEYLQSFHALSGDLSQMLLALTTTSLDRLSAITSLEKLLTITEVFARPVERSAVADDLAQLYEVLVRSNITDILASILQSDLQAMSHLSALRCLALFVPGPRVPSTPVYSVMHPSQMYFKRMAISSDIPAIASRFIDLAVPATCEQAVALVTAMISNDGEVRDYYLQNHILSLLCPLVLDTTPINILTRVAEAFAVLCGVSHAAQALPAWELIQPAFIPLGHLLFSDDETTLFHVLSAFSIILPGMRPDFSIVARILEIVNAYPIPAVVHQALLVIARVARFDSIQTASFTSRGLVDSIKASLNSTHAIIRSAALDVLEVLACVRFQFSALVNSGILEILYNLVPQDESLRNKLVSIILVLSQSQPLATSMAQQGFIPLLCGGLSWFKEYDSVISAAYQVDGPTLNYELVSDLVAALENLIMVGETARVEDTQGNNPCLLLFDGDCIDRIHEVLTALYEVAAAGADGWRRARDGRGALEQRLFNILHRIRVAFEAANTFNVNIMVKDRVIAAVAKSIDEFFPPGDQTSAMMDVQTQMTSSVVLIKCYLPDDIRVFEVAKDITFEALSALLTEKYQRELILFYLDSEGDEVRLEASSMSIAFTTAESSVTSTIPTVKIHLREKTDAAMLRSSDAGAFGSIRHSSDGNNDTNHIKRPESPSSEDEDAVEAASKKRTRSGDQVMLSAPQVAIPTAFGGNVKFGKELADLSAGANMMKEEFAQMRLVQRNQNFAQLRDATQFGDKELEALQERWAQNSPDGIVGREQFAEGMKQFGITDALIIEQNFKAFDVDGDGKIDFREFVVSLSTILKGSNTDRLRFMFRSYDADGSGNLSPEEVFNIFRASMAINGTVVSDNDLMQTVSSVFKEIDLDGNGEISFDEFAHAVLSNKLPVVMVFQAM